MFSIAIPAYKTEFLEECIQSVLLQTYEDFELIIVNDASPHDIDSIMYKFEDRRIKYFKNERNNGAEHLVDNWNQCLSFATKEYITVIGDDDKLNKTVM